MDPEPAGSPPQMPYHTSYIMEPLGESWFFVVLWAYAEAPLAACFFSTGRNFEHSGIGEGLVTSLWAGLSGAVLFMLLPLTKKGAGASRAAGRLPAGGDPGLFLAYWLQSDSSSLVGCPVHQGSLGHPGGQLFLGPDIHGENEGGSVAIPSLHGPLHTHTHSHPDSQGHREFWLLDGQE